MVRHNTIRDLLFFFCQRARLRPELEKVGLLEDDVVMVNLRRPADVLVGGATLGRANSRVERRALDVKVINCLGAGHLASTMESGVKAAEAYRESQLDHLNT